MTKKQLLSRTAAACAVSFALCSPVLASGSHGHGYGHGYGHGKGWMHASWKACSRGNAPWCGSSVSVPEIGTQGAAASLALVLGALALMTAYRRRDA